MLSKAKLCSLLDTKRHHLQMCRVVRKSLSIIGIHHCGFGMIENAQFGLAVIFHPLITIHMIFRKIEKRGRFQF
ncbi:Uncharacterised protein [Vibrio cholerae]|uniref:Uncharacterized protein n=1 Tax=Vibrio cholerae TaxID=666 RepID=A0A655ZSW5_VIBCL|nr:Uncharacterised protein [Vibrio cholerae]CSB38803.1 Uncharacterised protein [Vibrio cholerae]CSC25494.1 Uncharacterised protein [Vibrio cholerae]CSC45793.1 Uncharacterised protein [Vibrio cholerae]CSC77620.1 Uncharacterised protein [Vibrio cholerae]